MTIHGMHAFPEDIETLLLDVQALGSAPQRWPLGESWLSPSEFDSAGGRDLDEARQLLAHLIQMLRAGRGDVVVVYLRTGPPFQPAAAPDA